MDTTNEHRWGVILAGGEGVRLRSLTRLVSGEDTPKQFCALLGSQTLLTQTKERIARSIAVDRTLFVLIKSHERFYSKDLRSVSPGQMIVQPSNRGTLPAILCSLINIVQRDADAVVGIFPSDHHYSDEVKFMSGVDLAFAAAATHPNSVLLLGAMAKYPETEYGWIEPEVSTHSRDGFLRVKRFWEKPSTQTAHQLIERGCVWNTFVMVGRAQAFLSMIRASNPSLFKEFVPLAQSWDSTRLNEIYSSLGALDFSQLVLARTPQNLGVWCLGDVGWSDLGDPRRVMSLLSETGVTTDWMALWKERASSVALGQ